MICLIMVSVLSVNASYTVEEIPNVHMADRTKYVSNPDGILSQQAVDGLDIAIADIWQKTTAEVVAVVVKSIGEDEINDFATRLFEYWQIGKQDKSNGLLILVVEDQRKAVIRTGYGAEGLLPDVVCGRIIRQLMVPYFSKGDYDTGMLQSVAYIHKVLTTPGAVEELPLHRRHPVLHQRLLQNFLLLALYYWTLNKLHIRFFEDAKTIVLPVHPLALHEERECYRYRITPLDILPHNIAQMESHKWNLHIHLEKIFET